MKSVIIAKSILHQKQIKRQRLGATSEGLFLMIVKEGWRFGSQDQSLFNRCYETGSTFYAMLGVRSTLDLSY